MRCVDECFHLSFLSIKASIKPKPQSRQIHSESKWKCVCKRDQQWRECIRWVAWVDLALLETDKNKICQKSNMHEPIVLYEIERLRSLNHYLIYSNWMSSMSILIFAFLHIGRMQRWSDGWQVVSVDVSSFFPISPKRTERLSGSLFRFGALMQEKPENGSGSK